MFTKVKNSLSKINYKLFLALLVLGLCPTIYTTVRVFFLGELPGEYSFSIAGQLSWVNLLYEILSEAIVLPLFFFIGKVLTDKKEFANRMRTGLLVSVGAYMVLSFLIIALAKPLLSLMATDTSIINASATYIRIESAASIFSLAFNFVMVGMVTLGKEKYVYALTAVKLVLCLLVDTFMVSTLPVSLNLGVNGIAFSNIIVNVLLVATAIILLHKEGVTIFKKEKLSFGWMKEFAKVGGISGVESFVRNIAYMLMIARMMNMVGEQGTYHAFYQYYPHDVHWGPMHWGHVVSDDLLHWERLPIALFPGDDGDKNGCFSGSAIVWQDKLWLLYTGFTENEGGESIRQLQCLASSDDGVHFTKHGIVIGEKDLPSGYCPWDFRDPKVCRKDGAFWCVVAAKAQGAGGVFCSTVPQIYSRGNSSIRGFMRRKFFVWLCVVVLCAVATFFYACAEEKKDVSFAPRIEVTLTFVQEGKKAVFFCIFHQIFMIDRGKGEENN